MGSESDEIIEAAARAIQLRQDDPPRVDAHENWRDKGIDLQYDGHVIVRLRPADDDATSVQVFRREDLLASEVLRGYDDSATRLAELIEDVHERALSPSSVTHRPGRAR